VIDVPLLNLVEFFAGKQQAWHLLRKTCIRPPEVALVWENEAVP
jgi:hypothetical protein